MHLWLAGDFKECLKLGNKVCPEAECAPSEGPNDKIGCEELTETEGEAWSTNTGRMVGKATLTEYR